ncbi:MAG: DUF1540 domain-containing protein [Oscillospiraceae bacterium]|nr:DUF1540 domain-containing protein [Candidatus Equicaccousia limihippi]
MEDKRFIDGITCDVTNCLYHCDNCRCGAGNIQVGPGYANCCSETSCGTFKPKSDLG